MNISAAKDLDNGTKETILKAVLKNEDLLFQWALVTSNSDDEVGQKVLELIVYCTLLCEVLHSQNHAWNCTSKPTKSLYRNPRQ